MHHLRNLFVTGEEFGLVKLTSTEHSVETLKDGREALEAEVAEKTMELRAMSLKMRDLQESVQSDWDVLTWNNKLEKEKLSERKTFLKVLHDLLYRTSSSTSRGPSLGMRGGGRRERRKGKK